jgi:hypothetical protein
MLKPVLFSLTTFAAGCASMQIHSETAPQADLAHYRTFSWVPSSSGGPVTIIDQQIRAALARGLAQKGLHEAPPESADFKVSYHVLQEHKVAVSDWGNGIYGWSPEVTAYTDGSLIVDFIDPTSNKVFWRGSATSVVEHPGVVDVARLDKAAAQITQRYPNQLLTAR